MARREIQSEGKDVATAIIRGLNELGRRRDQVEVTVIQEEKSGFLGIGGRPAIVRIIEKKWDSEHSTPMKPRSLVEPSAYPSSPKGRGRKGRKDFKKGGRKPRTERIKTPKENEPQQLPDTAIQNAVIPEDMKPALACAKEALNKMLDSMGVKTENLNVWWDEKQHRILLTFDCDHPAIVIGKEGKTLESVQYIITLLVSRQFNTPISVMADTQNYWRKLEDKINREIDKALCMVKRTKRVYRFRPMSAQMRRYIHRFLADNLEITTVSEGEGKWRKVVIKPEPRPIAEQQGTKQEFIEQEATANDIAQHSCEETSEEKSCTTCKDTSACETCPKEEKTSEYTQQTQEQAVNCEEVKVEAITAGTEKISCKCPADNCSCGQETQTAQGNSGTLEQQPAQAEQAPNAEETVKTVIPTQEQPAQTETACAENVCPCCTNNEHKTETACEENAQPQVQTSGPQAEHMPAATPEENK